MRSFRDQTGHELTLDGKPQRIVSLVPSQTELLFDLGVGDRVVGVTLYCVHPKRELTRVTRVGGTKKVHMRRLQELDPDLIIGNKEENSRDQIEVLRSQYPTWISDILTLEDALAMIHSVGTMTGSTRHDEMISTIRSRFAALEPPPTPLRTAYLIWKDPVMVAGKGTFIDAMLNAAGLGNAFGHLVRYPEVSLPDLTAAQPDLVVLSSEPYSFGEADVPEFQRICPGAKVAVADATYFSWYGSRLLRAPEYFAHFLTYLQMI